MKSIHDVFVRDPLLIISCGGGKDFGGRRGKTISQGLMGGGRIWQVALKLLLIVSHGLKNLVIIIDML